MSRAIKKGLHGPFLFVLRFIFLRRFVLPLLCLVASRLGRGLAGNSLGRLVRAVLAVCGYFAFGQRFAYFHGLALELGQGLLQGKIFFAAVVGRAALAGGFFGFGFQALDGCP